MGRVFNVVWACIPWKSCNTIATTPQYSQDTVATWNRFLLCNYTRQSSKTIWWVLIGVHFVRFRALFSRREYCTVSSCITSACCPVLLTLCMVTIWNHAVMCFVKHYSILNRRAVMGLNKTPVPLSQVWQKTRPWLRITFSMSRLLGNGLSGSSSAYLLNTR